MASGRLVVMSISEDIAVDFFYAMPG